MWSVKSGKTNHRKTKAANMGVRRTNEQQRTEHPMTVTQIAQDPTIEHQITEHQITESIDE
jgi:hypothetical protein